MMMLHISSYKATASIKKIHLIKLFSPIFTQKKHQIYIKLPN